MINPIPRNDLFAYELLADIRTALNALPPSEKALVYSYVMATTNACHALVEQAIEDSKGAW
jgi:hypothetical protein